MTRKDGACGVGRTPYAVGAAAEVRVIRTARTSRQQRSGMTPPGIGYAMLDRSVTSRVLPDVMGRWEIASIA